MRDRHWNRVRAVMQVLSRALFHSPAIDRARRGVAVVLSKALIVLAGQLGLPSIQNIGLIDQKSGLSFPWFWHEALIVPAGVHCVVAAVVRFRPFPFVPVHRSGPSAFAFGDP
ncbi:hypothetical protein AWZ03_014924 [Drosophila navojoa]|uniref:Uncharacterized protein n=1 Tax=Drosophila navojoa TaxID=7232 RepID=A0A484AQB4_DRONA|nr:hypothetical protein AWZ03_014924 [Drosophila navojoa]